MNPAFMLKKIFKCSTLSRNTRVRDANEISLLISERDWASLLIVLGSQNFDDSDFTRTHDNDRETTLHQCCRFQAPLCVVCAIYRLNPQAVDRPDHNGRFPIHQACYFGAKIEVIEFLIKVSSELTVTAQDKAGKTPLHLTCEHYQCKCGPQWEDSQCVGVVKMLCEKAPDIINIEDDEGRTAIEMAIEFALPFKVVRTLQRASAADWRARRRLQRSHEEMQNDFKLQMSCRRLLTSDDSFSDLTFEPDGISTVKVDNE